MIQYLELIDEIQGVHVDQDDDYLDPNVKTSYDINKEIIKNRASTILKEVRAHEEPDPGPPRFDSPPNTDRNIEERDPNNNQNQNSIWDNLGRNPRHEMLMQEFKNQAKKDLEIQKERSRSRSKGKERKESFSITRPAEEWNSEIFNVGIIPSPQTQNKKVPGYGELLKEQINQKRQEEERKRREEILLEQKLLRERELNNPFGK